jgi:TetR/AcrR family fatty acid metabolism transcriptional regulator
MAKLSKNIIKKAAVELIKEKGLKEFTARNLAGKLGVTDAAIFKYFPTLRHLFEELLLDFTAECKQTFSAVAYDRQMNAEEKLVKLVEAYEIKFLQTNGAMPLLCFEIARLYDVGLQQIIKEYWDFYIEIVEEIVNQGKEEGIFRPDVDPKKVALTLNGFYISSSLRNIIVNEAMEEGTYLKLAKLVLEGIKRR